jgi:hypothetical protein
VATTSGRPVCEPDSGPAPQPAISRTPAVITTTKPRQANTE